MSRCRWRAWSARVSGAASAGTGGDRRQRQTSRKTRLGWPVGCRAYLEKPFDLDRLAACVEKRSARLPSWTPGGCQRGPHAMRELQTEVRRVMVSRHLRRLRAAEAVRAPAQCVAAGVQRWCASAKKSSAPTQLKTRSPDLRRASAQREMVPALAASSASLPRPRRRWLEYRAERSRARVAPAHRRSAQQRHRYRMRSRSLPAGLLPGVGHGPSETGCLQVVRLAARKLATLERETDGLRQSAACTTPMRVSAGEGATFLPMRA